MISIDEIEAVVLSYLDRYPDERDRIGPLLRSLAQRTAITARGTFTGHVTASALVFNDSHELLQIHHNVLRRWLQPGGHLEPQDTSLRCAALREAREEAGIGPDVATPIGDDPIYIDVHKIPENRGRGEPAHWHFDIRYAFRVPGPLAVELQLEEVSGYRWLPIAEIGEQHLRDCLPDRLGLPAAA